MAEDPKFVVHGSQVQKWTDDIQQLKQERDSLRKQQDELINDMAETKKKAKAFDLISNSYTTEIEQAIKNKELNQCLFLLEQILDDLERGSDVEG
ncbi:hypothetical protein KZX25_07500 [Staphylococcus epidermidis]|uniref:hypothetical protein n=1 Tax=Staphylococcus epidermidis TaxID=1282 RepID=UPI0020039BAA|nr:hypothetical protein [Staphylococcus epidermidis]MCK6118924.1 hypothetical protein [Staphylococcus epidermidis]MCK6155957.1 hypothetical protein [Staphylococcus epidermidis]